MSQDPEDCEDDDALEVFARHIVLLTGAYVAIDEHGKPVGSTKFEFYNFTGWACELFGRLHIVTAGHAIDDFFKALRAKRIRVLSGYLADSFGPDAKHLDPIPFVLEDVPHIYCDNPDAGLDFAVMQSTQNHADLIAANGVLPFMPHHWEVPSDLIIFDMALVGFP
jgi:hypothetical protein